MDYEAMAFVEYSLGFLLITVGIGVIYAIIEDFICRFILKGDDTEDNTEEDEVEE